MSKFLKDPVYSKKGLETQWINFTFQAHDLICGCTEVVKHFNHLVHQQPCLHFDETTTGKTGDGEKEETAFNEGDLEALFSEENDVTEG